MYKTNLGVGRIFEVLMHSSRLILASVVHIHVVLDCFLPFSAVHSYELHGVINNIKRQFILV